MFILKTLLILTSAHYYLIKIKLDFNYKKFDYAIFSYFFLDSGYSLDR